MFLFLFRNSTPKSPLCKVPLKNYCEVAAFYSFFRLPWWWWWWWWCGRWRWSQLLPGGRVSSSLPVESRGSISQRKASHEGRRVPLLIRAVLAIINRCWQELKLGTNLSHFTVQQSQIQGRGGREEEWLKAATLTFGFTPRWVTGEGHCGVHVPLLAAARNPQSGGGTLILPPERSQGVFWMCEGKPSGPVVPSHLAGFTAAHAERKAKWWGKARVSSLQSRAQGLRAFGQDGWHLCTD